MIWVMLASFCFLRTFLKMHRDTVDDKFQYPATMLLTDIEARKVRPTNNYIATWPQFLDRQAKQFVLF